MTIIECPECGCELSVNLVTQGRIPDDLVITLEAVESESERNGLWGSDDDVTNRELDRVAAEMGLDNIFLIA